MVPICWFLVAGSNFFALGNKSGGFCEAVNCERSEQEGKFLFAYLMVRMDWFPPPYLWHRLLVCHMAWRAQRAMQCGTTKAVYWYMVTNLWHRLLVCHMAWRAQRAMQCGTTKAVYQYMAPSFSHWGTRAVAFLRQ